MRGRTAERTIKRELAGEADEPPMNEGGRGRLRESDEEKREVGDLSSSNLILLRWLPLLAVSPTPSGQDLYRLSHHPRLLPETHCPSIFPASSSTTTTSPRLSTTLEQAAMSHTGTQEHNTGSAEGIENLQGRLGELWNAQREFSCLKRRRSRRDSP